MTTNRLPSRKHAGGRPPKFAEPRRPITVTLPERTLRQLACINADCARAIVKAAEATMNQQGKFDDHIQLVEVAPKTALIIVGPSRLLRQVPMLSLVEIAPARYLLAIPAGASLDSLEIALADLLEESTPATDATERVMLLKLLTLMRGLRRGGKVSKAEILLVGTAQLGLHPLPRTQTLLSNKVAPPPRARKAPGGVHAKINSAKI